MSFSWNAGEGDMYRSLCSLVDNEGYFKSERQAEFFRPRIEFKNYKSTKEAVDDSYLGGRVGREGHIARADSPKITAWFGIPRIKKDQYVLIVGGTMGFGGNRGLRPVSWAFVMDCQGVVKKYKLGYKEVATPDSAFREYKMGVEESKVKLEFTRVKVPSKELDVEPYEPTCKKQIETVGKNEKQIKDKKSKSQYIGTVGIRDTFVLKLVHNAEAEGRFGTSYIYFFEDVKENKVIWFSSRDKMLRKGNIYSVTGSVKGQEEYKGSKQTYLTRCKIEV